MKLADIAAALSGELIGDGGLPITRVVHPADAEFDADLAVALSEEAVAALALMRTGAVLVAEAGIANGRPAVIYGGPQRAAIGVLTELFDTGPAVEGGVHPAAVVAADARLGEGVDVAAGSVVGAGTEVGAATRVLANVTIGARAKIGANCVLHPGVVIGDRVEIGDRVIIQPNAVLGGDGFSFLPPGPAEEGGSGDAMPRRIHALGTVIVGDDVEIGAATTIDRATLRATRIGRGTKIDNQVQIAHNVVIGEACLICGQVGIAGSAVIGDRVLLSAGSGVADYITVGDDAEVTAGAGVVTRVAAGEKVAGAPAVSFAVHAGRYVNIARLGRTQRTVRAIGDRVDALEKQVRGQGPRDGADSHGGDA